VLIAGGVCFGVWKIRNLQKSETAREFALHVKAVYAG
jgi:hypothetical protein